jgi:hypothetical protein
VTRYSFLVLMFVFAGSLAAQQAMSTDERQIRDLIAAEDNGKRAPATSDRVFWSGAYKRPFVGSESGELVAEEQKAEAARVPESQRSTTTVRRIEIAKSGDLAYEFSDSELSYQLKNAGKVSFPRSVLRVWKKDGGQWKVAAYFARAHEK